ncbi:hypothetical protein PR202_gb18244 [Eleusine coracana subsp. coracana]|uniref:Uncharacterized protein n=1 Tax=Eleusine coracana subsp. coracana TaxID=191504 RepID=A0AAV5F533_ELECO|nr:hypothetical protein PR202_gb18244 [Eleusine coracana subsp. coracana]
MPASSSSSPGCSSACAPPPPPPRAMKRELAFALQSLSEISASPGRTRSGRPISSLPNSASSLKRRKRSAAPAADLVSPPTPPIHAEPPAVHHSDVSNPNAAAEVLVLQQVLENPQPMQAQPEPATEVEVIPEPDAPVQDSAAATDAPLEDSVVRPDALAEDSAAGPDAELTPLEPSRLDALAEDSAAGPDAALTLLEPSSSSPDALAEDSAAGQYVALALPAVAAGSDNCDDSNSNAGYLPMHAADNAPFPVPLAAQDTTTAAATMELKPARRFTRSLLKNKPDEEEATPSGSQETPQHIKGLPN